MGTIKTSLVIGSLLLLISIKSFSQDEKMLPVPGDRKGDPETMLPINDAMRYYMFTGNLERVRNAINSGVVDVNMIVKMSNGDAHSLLALAAFKGDCMKNNLPIVSFLLDKGAKVNSDQSSSLNRSINVAANAYQLLFSEKLAMVRGTWKGDGEPAVAERKTYQEDYNTFLEISKLLLQKGANPNQADNDNFPIIKATSAGSLVLVRLLLQYGASVKNGIPGNMPLMNCAAGEIHAWEMAAGKTAYEGREPTLVGGLDHLSALGLNMEQAKEMMQKAMKTEKAKVAPQLDQIRNKQPQWIELFSEYTEIVKLLIAKGTNVNVNFKSVTPLQQAEAYHITPMVLALKAAGAK